jgi:hypothetical protein
MFDKEIPKELLEKLIDPVFFTETFGRVKGKDFKFDQREHLFDIYRDPHPRIILLAGRQVEKSETLSRKLIHQAFTNPYKVSVYSSPRQDQTYRFSNDRFRLSLKNSKYNGLLMNSVDKDTTTHMTFKNSHSIYFGSAWGGADNLRGISGDFLYIDEFQDIDEVSYATMMEMLSHSEFVTEQMINGKMSKLRGRLLVAGTPKQTGSLYEKLWKLSDMKEWNPKTKKWESQKDPSQCLFSGYLLPQTKMPWISEEEIDYKRLTYDEQRFENEVLGKFYSGLLKPLTMDMIEKCLDPSFQMWHKGKTDRACFMGLDYGGGRTAYTVATIVSENPETEQLEIVLCHRFEEKHLPTLVEKITNMITEYNVQGVVADTGFGAFQNQVLQDEFGNMVQGCFYVAGSREPDVVKENEDSTMLTVDRSYQIQQVIEMIKRERIRFPYANPDQIKWAFDHYTCIEAEPIQPTTGRSGYIRYIHPDGTNDDALHSLVYARLAWEMGSRVVDYSFGERSEFTMEKMLELEAGLFDI